MFNEATIRLERDRDTLVHNANLPDCDDMPAMLQAASEIQDCIAFLKNDQIGGFGALVAQVRQWGVDKGLTGPTGKATVQGQLKKLEEEFEELKEGVEKQDQHEVVDAVGDMTVVLILLSELAGFRFETALRAAYDVIRHRTGRMAPDGTFVKDQP